MAQWEVSYRTDRSDSDISVMIEADTAEQAAARAHRRATAFGYQEIKITGTKKLTSSLLDDCIAIIVECLPEAQIGPVVSGLNNLGVSVKEIHNTSTVDHAYVFIIDTFGYSMDQIVSVIHQYNNGGPVH